MVRELFALSSVVSSIGNFASPSSSDFFLLLSVSSNGWCIILSFNTAVMEVVLTIFVVEVIVAVLVSSLFDFFSFLSAEEASASSFLARSETFFSVGTSSMVREEDSTPSKDVLTLFGGE